MSRQTVSESPTRDKAKYRTPTSRRPSRAARGSAPQWAGPRCPRKECPGSSNLQSAATLRRRVSFLISMRGER